MKTIKSALVAISLASAAALTGCSGEEPSDAPVSEENGDLGRVNLNLQAGGNQVDAISYVVTALPSNTIVRSATVDVSPDVANATSWLLLPPGNYSVALTSEATPPVPPPDGTDTYPCSGSATFTVTANGTVQVPVVLECLVPGSDIVTGQAYVNAEFEFVQLDSCGVTDMFVGPTATSSAGGVVTLMASGTPGLTYAWSEDGDGAVTDPAAQNSVYTCAAVETVEITLTVTNTAELCVDEQSITIECLGAPNCGNGTFEPGLGEECDPAVVAGPDCTAACTLIECGDGAMEGDEECDDGDTDSGDGCSDVCVVEFCGDSVVQTGLGEACDPPVPGAVAGQCGPGCQIVAAPVQTCEECTAEDCSALVTACEDPVNTISGVARCTNVVDCWEATDCNVGRLDQLELCLCGQYAPVDCAGGSADGPCASQMRLGASTTAPQANVLNTILRFIDPGYATGDAGLLLQCQKDNCAASCDWF